jgi:hypothetical protein
VQNQPRRFARRTRPALGVALRAIVDEQQWHTLVWSGSTPGNLILHCDVHVTLAAESR